MLRTSVILGSVALLAASASADSFTYMKTIDVSAAVPVACQLKAVASDSSGNYTVPLLPQGNYRMEVSATGFKRFILEGITLQVQQTARIDVNMTVGEVAESVTVTALPVRSAMALTDRSSVSVTGR